MVLAFAFALILDASLSQGEPPPPPPLKGHVRSVREEYGDVKDPKAKRIPTRTTKYDRQGRLTEELRFEDYNSPVHIVGRSVFHYDRQGRQSEIISFDETEKPPTAARHLYKRNAQGQTVKEIQLEGREEDNRTQYEYDSAGNCVKETLIDGTGAVTSTTIRTFDSNRNVLRENTSGARQSDNYERTYQYTLSGHPSELTSTKSGVLEYRARWTYNELGQLTAGETFVAGFAADTPNWFGSCGDCGPSPGRSTYRYDEAGRLTERFWFQGDNLVRFDHFSYDSHGNEVELWEYTIDAASAPRPGMTLTANGKDYTVRASGGLPSRSYRYDEHGNWVESVTYTRLDSLDGTPKPSEVRYRIIEYH